MPVVDLTSTWVNPDSRPDWLGVTAVGRFHLDTDGARFERHHHRDHELWYIVRGKARIASEGVEAYVQAGELVVTQAGETHDFLAIYESVDGLFLETGLPDGGSPGHLYESPADEGGHDVPLLPLPADFPLRVKAE